MIFSNPANHNLSFGETFTRAYSGMRFGGLPVRAGATPRPPGPTGVQVRMAQLSGAMALLRALIAHDIDTVFALPGGQLDCFFDALYHERARVRLIGSRHEQGAAYMAFGYARS